jgi:hypothetical protein
MVIMECGYDSGLGKLPPEVFVAAANEGRSLTFGAGGDDAADALRLLVATKARTVTQKKLRWL